MITFRTTLTKRRMSIFAPSIFGIIILAVGFYLTLNKRPVADVTPDELPTPVLSTWWLNKGSVSSPDPNGYSIFLKIKCPEEDNPCDPIAAEVEVQHKDKFDDKPDPRSYLGSIDMGGIGPRLTASQDGETTSVPYSTEDGVFFKLDVEEPEPGDEWTFFVSFVVLSARSQISEITARFPDTMPSVVNP